MWERLFVILVRILLKLRYKVQVQGVEYLKGKKGVLLLPNHPAEIDPVILSACVWKYTPLRPVVLEKYYFLPGVHFLMRQIRAIAMPDMDVEPGPYKRRRVLRAINTTIQALEAGENILLYPAGRVMTSGRERLGGSSAVRAILDEHPELPIVLVRTRGLYGSIFSKALTGGVSPDFFAMLREGLRILLMNLLFFAPKRPVNLEFEIAPVDFPRDAALIQQNRWLEEWYNKDGGEFLKLVSRKFWKDDFPKIQRVRAEDVDLSHVKPEVVEEVINKIASLGNMAVENIKLESHLGDDIGLDSLNVAELLSWLDERFAVNDVDIMEIATVASVVRVASGHVLRPNSQDAFVVPEEWHEDASERPEPLLPEAATIQEAFLRTAVRMGNAVAMADERSGVLTWKRAKIAVLLLANELKNMPGEHVGILLPASVGAALLVLAALFAKKVPVMLNWTAGRRNVEHAIKTCALSHVISSEAFLDLIDTDLEYVEDKLLLVEDIKKKITLQKKLRCAFLASRSVETILAHYALDKIDAHSTAVVLFTSGSEADPKGVPLSQRNILANVDGGLSHFHFDKSDVMYGFLPPFHSFGLTVCCFVPLLSGLKVVYHPNPNESRKLAAGCEKWGVTIMSGTPTFLKGILRAGSKEQFNALRILVAGAEKAPQDLFDLTAEMTKGAEVIEGYGITECSPVVSGNRPGYPAAGVGWPLKGVEILIVHHETLEPLAEGERGLILIWGESVFGGYIAGRASPFVEVQGKQWYNSGDLGFIKDGALHISGRLKRFVKIGGEMLSLTAVEEVLSKEWPSDIEEGPALSVTALEKDDGGRPELHLFTTRAIDLDEVNLVLVREGFANIVKINRVHQVGEIPVLGSGKTDIQELNRMLKGLL